MPRLRTTILVLAGIATVLTSTPAAGAATAPARATPKWIARIEQVIGDRPVSVAIGVDGNLWYQHLSWVGRPPASNEKLLLSMALLDRFSPDRTIRTDAMAAAPITGTGVVQGDLWIVGHGDPEVDAADMGDLARRLVADGLTKVRGSVIGSTGPFARDWFATGWKEYFPADYVALPTALTFDRNVDEAGTHVTDPERRAAVVLTRRLTALGVIVHGKPSMDTAPSDLVTLAEDRSAPLVDVLRHMNMESRNFWAEVLGKYLGAQAYGHGTIANGAKAIDAFVAGHGLDFTCYDSSGLSYANRATARGILELLWTADQHPWGSVLRSTLPAGGQGTLEDRLTDVKLRAKTGTLDDASALSGWLWSERTQGWVEFSIVSSGFDERTAKTIEDQIVKVVAANGVDPTP